MNLGDIITRLETANPNQVVPHGFHNPHSYRGDYYDLAFEPTTNITIADMLEAARSAVGATYQGYKGGDFKMTAGDWCWLSEEGSASGETISPLLLEFMLRPEPAQPAVDGEQSHRTLHRWYIEIRDGHGWDITSRFHADRDAAVRDMARRNQAAPQWDDGRPVQRRLVRETTTHTVEEA